MKPTQLVAVWLDCDGNPILVWLILYRPRLIRRVAPDPMVCLN